MKDSKRRSARERRRVLVRFGRSACFTVDIGEGGFSARLLRPLPLHAPLEGSVQVEGKTLPFSGRVAWIRPGDWQLQLPGTMGVRFTRAPQGLLGLFDAGNLQKRRLFGT